MTVFYTLFVLLIEKDIYYILTNSYNFLGESEPIKIFNLKRGKLGEINDSKDAAL